jgi:WD40 repeat protein
MSEDSQERYGGVLAAPARPGWRTILDVIGALDVIAAAVLAAVIVTHHGSVGGCQALTPPAGSRYQHVWAVAFSPDGRTLATVALGTVGDGGRTYLWDVATGRRRTATLSDPSTGGAAASVAFSPDGTTVAVVDGSDGADLWDVTTHRLIAVLTKAYDSADVVAFNPDAVAFSPDGRILAVGTANRRVGVWDVATGRLIATLTAPDGGAVSGVAFSPDSRMLAFVDGSHHAYLCPSYQFGRHRTG